MELPQRHRRTDGMAAGFLAPAARYAHQLCQWHVTSRLARPYPCARRRGSSKGALLGSCSAGPDHVSSGGRKYCRAAGAAVQTTEQQNLGWAQHAARCAAAAALAVALSLSDMTPATALAFGVSPAATGEGPLETLQRTLRQADRELSRGVRSTQQQISDGIQAMSAPLLTPAEAAEAQRDGEQLVWEVWDVVDREFLDARATGFDRGQWATARDSALAGPLDSPAAAHRAVRTMLGRCLRDPYTKFISPQEFDDMKAYDVTGVGLNLGSAEEFTRKVGSPFPPGRQGATDGVWVVGLIKGSAAETAGIRQGDELVALDGQPVVRYTPYQVSAMLGGAPSSDGTTPPPRLTVAVRDSEGHVREHAIARTVRVNKPTVQATLEQTRGGVKGRLRIATFTGRTQAEVAAALKRFQEASAAEVELDLRGNLGGLVSQGVETARLFLDEGATIVVKEEGRDAVRTVMAATGPPLSTAPLTVLVDGDTASAAEILAGALKDNCRALLVGSRTYGKGLIQSIYELHDASGLALTVGRYRTPGGADIDRTGIVPDFRSPPSVELAAARLRACAPPPRNGT